MYGKPGRRKRRLNAEEKNGQIALWGLYGNKAAALAISMCLRVFFQVKYLLSGLLRWGTVFTVCKNVISHPRKIKKTRDFKRLREIV